MAMTFERETVGHIPVRFLVGDTVNVLVACHLPKRETVMGSGRIHRVSQSAQGQELFWIEGFPMARTAGVLRLVQRGSRESFDQMNTRIAAECRRDEIDEGIIDG